MTSRSGVLFWRTASSLLAGPLFLLFVYLGGWPLNVLAGGLAILGLREFLGFNLDGSGVARAGPVDTSADRSDGSASEETARAGSARRFGGRAATGGPAGSAVNIVAYVLLPFFFLPQESPAALAPLVVSSMLALSAAGLYASGAFRARRVAVAFFALWYIGGGFFYLPVLRAADGGWERLLLAILATWAVDVTAFFVGTALGRHRLAPALSPGKTVEGALGGLAGGLIVAAVGARMVGMSILSGLGMGLVVGVAAQLGDLAESAIKRTVGAKDSGSFLPGHGGLLDRFDSMLFVLPVVYWYWRL